MGQYLTVASVASALSVGLTIAAAVAFGWVGIALRRLHSDVHPHGSSLRRTPSA